MRKNLLLYILVIATIAGIISTTSCKRSKVEDPDVIGPAGFRISLSGTASPSTMYVPADQTSDPSVVTVTALHNDGTPAAGYKVVFEEGAYGYFEGYKVSDFRITNGSGVAQINYYIPAGSPVKATIMTNINVTLMDDGRLDNTISAVYDVIPVKLIPYLQQGIELSGYIRTPAGNGVSDIPVVFEGDGSSSSGLVVTDSGGRYRYFVAPGWYGSITPNSQGYNFVPANYTFEETAPLYNDRSDLNFVASFESGNTLATDVTSWTVLAEGGTQEVNVTNSTGDATINYTVTPDSEWIHVNPSSGDTPGRFTITVDENTLGEDRSGTVVVNATNVEGSNVTINIDQKGKDVSDQSILAADREEINFVASSGDPSDLTATVNVYNAGTSESIEYIITKTADWVNISATSGNTNDSFNITVETNTEEARSTEIKLYPTSTGVANSEVTITVNQEAAGTLSVDISERNVGAGGETFIVNVTNPTTSEAISFGLSITGSSWISVVPSSMATPSQLSITVSPNASALQRTGYITIMASTGAQVVITITQSP